MTAVVAIIGGEIFARYYLGLGSPPLSITLPQIEYMFKPNQDVMRFGNHFIVNQYGMRTGSFDAHKIDNGQFRVMVFGDSVLNGGNQTDHAALATTLLQNRLAEKLKLNAVVGNISAGSWGPGNWLAYAKEYGFFDANIVVLVISSHDYVDNPTFEALNQNTHPTKNPASALLEGITRYLPRYLPQLNAGGAVSESDRFEEQPSEKDVQRGLNDLTTFLELARSNSTNVVVLQHWEKSEVERGIPNDGHQRIRQVCESIGVPCISLEPRFRQSIKNGNNPYRDNIHLNQIGQKILADALFENLPNTALQRTR
jgi:lysophospholipase L1-like esterase